MVRYRDLSAAERRKVDAALRGAGTSRKGLKGRRPHKRADAGPTWLCCTCGASFDGYGRKAGFEAHAHETGHVRGKIGPEGIETQLAPDPDPPSS